MTPDTPVRFENALTFKASRGPFFRLLLVNTLLTVVTLGIYRFWAKTRVRRYLWHNIRLLDDPLEYTGTGGELFFGFLIVLAVLFPFGLIYNAISVLVPSQQTGLRIGIEALYYLVLFSLIQIGFYRMWRYRMSRTVWRGIRCGLDGSSWTYLRLAVGWTLLTAVTLGISYPWMQIDLWRYRVAHTWLGDEAFGFDGDARHLLGPWLAVLGPFLWFAATAMAVNFSGLADWSPATLKALGGLTAILFALLPALYLWYRVCLSRLEISGLAVGGARFGSTLPYWRLMIFAGIAYALMLLCLLPLVPFAISIFSDVAPNVRGQSITWHGTGPASLGFAFIAIVAIIWPIIYNVVFRFEIIKQVTMTTTIDEPHKLETASQRAVDVPRTGEGLADALDIGGF